MAFFAYAPAALCVVARHHEFENRFWTCTAFLFSAAVLYIRDSPLAVGQWNSALGLVLVFGFTLSVHYFDRFLHRQEISRRPRLKTATRHLSHNLFQYKAGPRKTALLVECVSRIDRRYLPSTINNMLNLAEVKQREHKIFRILAGAGKDELNYVVNRIPLALLFYKVKDHSKVREDQSRTLMLDLLCSAPRRPLGHVAGAAARRADGHEDQRAAAGGKVVRNIILKTRGTTSDNLKTYTDAKGDHSMHKLVFNDIRDPTVRTDVISHIQREASVQIAHTRLGTKRGRSRKQQAWRKVLGDVDDTLYSSGGRYPAGLDTRFPRHTLCPGVLAFYRELDMGTVGPDDWTGGRVGNLVFLSAQSGHAFMWQGELEPMAQKKFENSSEFYQLYPEFKHVFVGDNGQGRRACCGANCGETWLGRIRGCVFSARAPMEKMYNYHSKEDLNRWRAMNIFFFDTYVGAAVRDFSYERGSDLVD
ncbi:unnamed protein product [Hyaloperonospora brassicae]|uniref:Uncharacterized protein n=1 Tax=Hyaloperonospora brassicae TaxID=162125 RepID=A0AAV0V0G2_HYABA|nr:unnamed protein product [Hyaloperonospora brassicae]